MGKIQDIMEQMARKQAALEEQALNERLSSLVDPAIVEMVNRNPELEKEMLKAAGEINNAVEFQKIDYKSFATKIRFGDLILELNDSFEDLDLELNEEDEYNDNLNSPLE